MHHVTGVEFPFEIAARRIHRVQVLVATAEKYGAIDHQWAGQEHVVHVGIGLRPGLQAMQAARLEAAFALGGELPKHFAIARIERVEPAVVADREHAAVDHCGSR